DLQVLSLRQQVSYKWIQLCISTLMGVILNCLGSKTSSLMIWSNPPIQQALNWTQIECIQHNKVCRVEDVPMKIKFTEN
ncbi:hypothetical protein MKW98_019120, partial [Papaver atlanticum]